MSKSVAVAGNGYTLVEHAPLQARNTFGVPAKTELLIDVHRIDALGEVLAFPLVRRLPLLVLGAGSNVLFTRDWPGVVLSLFAHAIEIRDDDGRQARIRVEAGANWNDFVHWSLAHGFAGLENLVAIPGTVGAAPIQNIGAYGTEVAEFIEVVEVFDRHQGRIETLSAGECAFAYRDSLFKHAYDRYIVTAVEFVLPRQRALRLDYAGVREELAAMGVDRPTPATTAEAVARVRARKLPDPAAIGNAGSFFKNPLVDGPTLEALREKYPDLPHWPAGEGAKVSAAWLIEHAGLRGAREGDAAVSKQHALVLVNLGRATGAEILALARHVRDGVASRFGIELEPEPRIVGA